MAHPATPRACDVSRRQHMPCRPRVPTPGDADGFTGRRNPGDGRCRLAGGRLRAKHRPGPPFRADAVVPTAVGNGTKIRDGNVAGWRDRQRKIDDGRGGMDSRGSTTHRIGSGSTLIRRPPDGQRAPRHDAEAATPGASASARRRMTDNDQALQCREEGRPAPGSPRNRLAAYEKRCFGVPPQASPQHRPRRAARATRAGTGRRRCRGLRFTRGQRTAGPTSVVKIGSKLAPSCAGGGRHAEPPGALVEIRGCAIPRGSRRHTATGVMTCDLSGEGRWGRTSG